MMLSSLLLIGLCGFLILGQAFPAHATSIKSTQPDRIIPNNPNHPLGAIEEYANQAPLTPILAKSSYSRVLLTLAPYCDNKGFPWQRIWVPVDTCYKITQDYLSIKKAAVCPDGTPAKLAIYSDDECRSMVIISPIQAEWTDFCLQTDLAFTFNFMGGGWGKMKSLKVLCKDSLEYDTSLAVNATMKLFTESTEPLEPTREDRCTGVFNTVSLPTDSCLSGDYYLTNNLLITQEAICPNGRLPVMIYYAARGCAGPCQYTSGGRGPGGCVWNEIQQPRYWSMIWRCEPKPAVWYVQGAKSYQAAIAPLAPRPDPPGSAVVVPFLSPDCTWQEGNSPITVTVGDCLTTPGFGIQILEAAVCENGTRAQWARFQNKDCTSSFTWGRYGLFDIPDRDLRKCLSLGHPDRNWEIIRSVAFRCD